MSKDIQNMIDTCEVCIKHDKIISKHNPATALYIDNIFDRWAIDITGGLAVTKEGFHAILTVVESLT